MKEQKCKGMAIIAILFSLVIAAIVIYVAIILYTGGKGQDETIKSPLERGKAVQCLAQVRRLETALQMYRVQHGEFPQALSELEDMSESEFVCPVTGSQYEYDPTTGKITCPDHP
jgi:type II secretory pathway pseudopilin PulG